jgi:hypothetical protein
MPRISKHQLSWCGVPFDRIINYDPRAKHFIIPIPAFIQEVLVGHRTVTHETQEGVEQEFRGILEAYEKAITSNEKVIIYDFECTAFIMDPVKKVCVFREEQLTFTKGTSLSFFYQVATKSVCNGRITYVPLSGHSERYAGLREEKKEIPWTEERENFFKSLNENLEMLILKAWTFLNTHQEDLAGILDGQKPLPPAVIMKCPRCDGSGKWGTETEPCPLCKGEKIWDSRVLKVGGNLLMGGKTDMVEEDSND